MSTQEHKDALATIQMGCLAVVAGMPTERNDMTVEMDVSEDGFISVSMQANGTGIGILLMPDGTYTTHGIGG